MGITTATTIHEKFPKQATGDLSMYNPSPEDLTLLKRLTGIQDEVELKAHVMKVQAEAYEVYPYPCIAWFQFITSRIAKYPFYNSIVELGKERHGAIFLDLGCCFGNDARRVIADGYPLENVVMSDLQGGFCELANKLYQTTPEIYPVPFLAGDIFDPAFFSEQGPSPSLIPPILKDLITLSPLRSHVSVIHTAYFFHLFDEEKQRQLATILSSLLSLLPGSMIVGNHLDLPDSEEYQKGGLRWSDRGKMVFAHSPTSWKAMWEDVFGIGKVKIESWVERFESPSETRRLNEPERYLHTWKVTRI